MNEKNEDGEDLVNPYPKKGESGDRKSTVKNVVGETTSKGVHVDVQRILSQPMIDVIQLRDLLFKHGLPNDAHRERALCWRLLLDFLPFNREAWEPTLCDKRSLYEIYKNELPALSVPDIWQTSADDDDDDDEEGGEEAEDEKETTKKTDDKKLSSDDQRVEAGDQSTTILNSTNDNNENNSSVDGGSVSTTNAKPTTQDAKILDETKKTDVDAKNNHNAEAMQTNNSNSNNDSQSTQADQPCEEDKQVESDQEQSTQTKLKIEKNENDKNSPHAATENNTDKTTLIQNDNDKDKSVDNNNDNENSNDGDDLKKKADATQQQQQQQQQPMVDESDELNLAFDLPSPPSDTAESTQLETSSPLDANEESVCADLLPDVPLSSSSNNNDNNASNSATDSIDVSPSLVLANEMEPSELERCVSCIDRDVPRTGRLVPALFGDGGAATEHAHAVRRILYMYSALNAGVGYTSGMHLLAAHIYCTLKRDVSEFGTHAEADAFWLFSSLMSELISRHIVGLMADPSMAQHWPQYVCTAIKQRDPELSAKLDDSSLLGAASVWARTLFATMVAPTSDVPRLWDMLLAGQLGSSLLAATLGLLSLRRASLVNGTFAECTQLLNSAYAVAPLMAATRRTAAELAGTPGLAQRMARMQSTARDKFGALSDSARKKMRRLSAGGLRRTGTTDTTTTTNNNNSNSNAVDAGGRPAGTWRRPDDLDEDNNSNNSNNNNNSSSNNDTSTDGIKSVQRKAETTASLERASAAALSFELPDVPTSVTQHSSVDTASATPPANTAQGTRRSGWAERQGHR